MYLIQPIFLLICLFLLVHSLLFFFHGSAGNMFGLFLRRQHLLLLLLLIVVANPVPGGQLSILFGVQILRIEQRDEEQKKQQQEEEGDWDREAGGVGWGRGAKGPLLKSHLLVGIGTMVESGTLQ